MQVRGIGRGVPGGPDVSEHIALRYMLSLVQMAGVFIEMSIVIAVFAVVIELVDRISSCSAVENPTDGATNYCMHWSPMRAHYVDRFMTVPIV